MLPLDALRPAYDKAVWLYVHRDFSGNEADAAAERVCLRLGMSAFPQHFLIEPRTLERLADTGRAVDGFLAAMNRVRVEKGGSLDAVRKITEADAKAIALEKSASVGDARKAIDDEDVVVRLRALGILAEKEPAAIAKRAKDLLQIPHDPFRYAVCKALAKAGDASAARPLDALLRDAPKALNPNVVRIEAASALGACGDAASIDALQPFAASGDARNGLTGVAVDAIAAIAARDAKAKPLARTALVAAYPAPPSDPADTKLVVALAKRVHEALAKVTGKKVAFPETYDAAARKKLAAGW
ncbi:MAG: HEAT repeat domain-containing protein [Planctomycetes bacterium]|nr:HEAT repeat domain-containing protein [Planctomycetota bacterium]